MTREFLMRLVVCCVLATLFTLPGIAAAQTDPTKEFTLDGSVTLTTDYRFRGISQSDRSPAIQGTANVTHASGLYIGTFVSTIGRYVVDGADPEIDLYAGVKKTIGGTAFDAGLLYYWYPGTNGFAGNSFEPYASASRTLGPVTARIGGNIAWKQSALGLEAGERRSGLYTYGELAVAVPTTPITLNGHVGHAYRATYGTFGERYTDWSLGATYVFKHLSGTVSYIDTNKNIESYPVERRNRNVSGAGCVASIALAF